MSSAPRYVASAAFALLLCTLPVTMFAHPDNHPSASLVVIATAPGTSSAPTATSLRASSKGAPYTMPDSTEWPTDFAWNTLGDVKTPTFSDWQNECWSKFHAVDFGIIDGSMNYVPLNNLSQYDLIPTEHGMCCDSMSCAFRHCGALNEWSSPQQPVNTALRNALETPEQAGELNLPAKVLFLCLTFHAVVCDRDLRRCCFPPVSIV